MKKNRTYVIRVHENEFKYIKKNSPVLRRILKLYNKRQKRYAQIAKNEEKARPIWEAYEASYQKQAAAVKKLSRLMHSRRPAGVTTDPLEEDLSQYDDAGKFSIYYTSRALIEKLLEPLSEEERNDYAREQPVWRSFCGIHGRPWKLMRLHLGITRINDFRRITPAELCAIPGFGAGSVKKLMAGLKRFGITLGDLVPVTLEHVSAK